MSTMQRLDALPAAVRAEVEGCDHCESDRKPRAFVCEYHEGWMDGYEAGKPAASAVTVHISPPEPEIRFIPVFDPRWGPMRR